LLRGSFRPHEQIVALRAYLRHRERLVEYAASHIQHMQKSLMQMNLQLHHVVSDITGVTGMKIIRAILDGERTPSSLAEFRDVRCKASVETIGEALTGNYRDEHVFSLRQAGPCSFTTSTLSRSTTATARSSAACAPSTSGANRRRSLCLRHEARVAQGTSPTSRFGRRCTRSFG
jgi:hypothetical protein